MTSSPATAGTAPSAVPAVGVVLAGLCVHGQHQREADVMLNHLADRLQAAGCPAQWLSTHRVEVGDGRAALACSIRWSTGCSSDAIWAVLLPAARESGAAVHLGEARQEGPPELVEAARKASHAAAERSEGRAVVFPGSRDLVGTLTVAEVLARSAIDSVAVLANGVAAETDLLDTRNFVRPIVRCGKLELLVQPAVGEVFVPFEVPNPTPCCADHA